MKNIDIFYKNAFWYQDNWDFGFVREKYLKKLRQVLGGERLIKVLTGQRRVGKSYILKQIIYELITQQKIRPEQIFYLSKDEFDFGFVNNAQELNRLISQYYHSLPAKETKYIFIDEIQEIANWEKLMISLKNHADYEIFITGSNSKMLSSELTTLLTGRFLEFRISPFDFQEFCAYFSLEPSKESFLRYLHDGGLPVLYQIDDPQIRKDYLFQLQNTILFKDIAARYNIRDSELLATLFRFVVDNAGNFFSINKIAENINHSQKDRATSIKYETVANYLQYMEEAFLIHHIDRYDLRGKKILAAERKYYLNDLSFKSYLTSSFTEDIGRGLENIFFIFYQSLGYSIFTGKIDTHEVDFILEKYDKKKYIQVTMSLLDQKVQKREFQSLEEIQDNYDKFVISLDDLSLGQKEGITHLLAWEVDDR